MLPTRATTSIDPLDRGGARVKWLEYVVQTLILLAVMVAAALTSALFVYVTLRWVSFSR